VVTKSLISSLWFRYQSLRATTWVIRPKMVCLPLNLNTLICRLRGVRVKLLFYAKILLINPMPLASVLIRI